MLYRHYIILGGKQWQLPFKPMVRYMATPIQVNGEICSSPPVQHAWRPQKVHRKRQGEEGIRDTRIKKNIEMSLFTDMVYTKND